MLSILPSNILWVKHARSEGQEQAAGADYGRAFSIFHFSLIIDH
jgi:hypothetical protein